LDAPSRHETGPDFDDTFRSRLHDLLAWRRDVRRFRPDPIPAAEMEDLLRIACLAPSVGNAQPWRFVRISSSGMRHALAEHVDAENALAREALPEADRAAYAALKLHGLREAPELLAVFCDEQPGAGRGLGRRTMPETLRYSTVLAVHTLWLAARSRGIGVGWVSILEPARITSLLELPAHWCLVALLCIGRPVEETEVPELERAGWQCRLDWQDVVLER
jgi:5,6-dimethylbenzimidazole synthase